MSARRLPPINWIGIASMVMTIISTIWLASYIPRRPPLVPSVVLMCLSGGLLVANALLLARLREFAWQTFRVVAGWTLAAYAVIAGMLEFAFIYDGTRGAVLLLMTLSLLTFAVNVPVLVGFGVARYQPAD